MTDVAAAINEFKRRKDLGKLAFVNVLVVVFFIFRAFEQKSR